MGLWDLQVFWVGSYGAFDMGTKAFKGGLAPLAKPHTSCSSRRGMCIVKLIFITDEN